MTWGELFPIPVCYFILYSLREYIRKEEDCLTLFTQVR
jgi:hypothetical protein